VTVAKPLGRERGGLSSFQWGKEGAEESHCCGFSFLLFGVWGRGKKRKRRASAFKGRRKGSVIPSLIRQIGEKEGCVTRIKGRDEGTVAPLLVKGEKERLPPEKRGEEEETFSCP